MERIELRALDHVVERAWRSTGGAEVRFGRAGDQWFVWHSRRGAAWVCRFERSACDLADQWLARGQWQEMPATAARTEVA
jgi:hypothetical protein